MWTTSAHRPSGSPRARRSALAAAGAVTLVGVLLGPTPTLAPAQAAPPDLIPPAAGILPGPAPGGDTPGSWGPCVPDPGSQDNCTGWLVPPGAIVESFPGTDDGPSVIVGGDFTAGLASAETEGLLVVGGDAEFLKSYNVGVAGGGTGVVPAADADMLIVGGDATVANPSQDPNVGGVAATVPVGLTTTDGSARFGNLHVGGTWNFRDPSYSEASNPGFGILGNVDTANQDPLPGIQNFLDDDVSVLDDDSYTDLFGAEGKMSRYSQLCYAELSQDTTATQVVNEGGVISLEHGTVSQDGNDVTLTASGTADLVEFTLPASLGAAGSYVVINIVGVAPGQTVLINTLDEGPVEHYIGDVYWGAGTDEALNTLALENGSAVLWNYPFTTDLTLGGAGQFPGSVLVGEPASSTNLGFSGSNGRVYTPGDLLHSGTAAGTTGNEMHSYPFDGALGCIQAVPGTFSVTKALAGDGADAVPADTTFAVAWEVTGPPDSPNLGDTGSLDVAADGTSVTGPPDLAEGDEVTLSEPDLPEIDGVDWGEVTIEPNPVTIGGQDTVAEVTVTNTATLLRGGFAITKTVDGDPGAATTEFTGTWTCDAANTDGDDTGTWTLSDGEQVTLDGFPLGTTCTVTEDPPQDTNGTWTTTVEPGQITITDGEPTATLVTVTNTFSSEVGAFEITKIVGGDDGSDVSEFTVAWTCVPPAGAPSSGTVTVGPGATSDPVGGFPVGTVCTISEPAVEDPNGTWVAEITPDELVIGSADPADVGVVTVTNTFEAATGGFAITKAVGGDDGAATTDFTGTWTCDAVNTDGEDTGTWTLTDGQSLTLDGFTLGTTCAVTEDAVDETDGTWETDVAPGQVTITDGPADATLVTVTNTFTRTVPSPSPSPSNSTPTPTPTGPAPTPGPDILPQTGSDVRVGSALAAALVMLGTLALVIARRRSS